MTTSALGDLQGIVLAAFAVFWIGLLGLVLRRSLVGMLFGLGLAWASVAVIAIAFGLLSGREDRAVAAGGLALCAAIVGCLQVVVGLAIVFARVGRKGSIDAEEARLLEG